MLRARAGEWMRLMAHESAEGRRARVSEAIKQVVSKCAAASPADELEADTPLAEVGLSRALTSYRISSGFPWQSESLAAESTTATSVQPGGPPGMVVNLILSAPAPQTARSLAKVSPAAETVNGSKTMSLLMGMLWFLRSPGIHF